MFNCCKKTRVEERLKALASDDENGNSYHESLLQSRE